MKTAFIRFYAELNDFLPAEKKQKIFNYRFILNPSIKDVIESCGVPHPEIDIILVNRMSVDFEYHIQDGDYISVYPVFESLDVSPLIKLRAGPLREIKFILDNTLGKLVKKLRMLGFDTAYELVGDKKEFVQRALGERRIILTRSQNLLKNKSLTHGYWVRTTDIDEQVQEVISRFDLYSLIHPFKRCLRCNGLINPVLKDQIIDKLPPAIKSDHDQFWQCSHCKQVYWQGTHYQKMVQQIKQLNI